MISAGDFRNGITIEVDGNIFQIVEFRQGRRFCKDQAEKYH